MKVYREIAAEVMEPVPHQEALSKIGRADFGAAAAACAGHGRSRGRARRPAGHHQPVTRARRRGDVCRRRRAGDGALSRILPDTTFAFYIHDAASGHLVARHAMGEHAAVLRGTSIAMSERLSGWVAACRQTIANSDAALDLYDRGVKLGSALSTPLFDGERVVGVFTAYAAASQAFTEDQSRLVEMMAPHLGRIVGAAMRTEQRTRDNQEPRVAAARARATFASSTAVK